jgi:hypothetical protein
MKKKPGPFFTGEYQSSKENGFLKKMVIKTGLINRERPDISTRKGICRRPVTL